MRFWLGVLIALLPSAALAQSSVTSAATANPGVTPPTCVSANASGSSLVCSAHNLYGFYCGGIAGSAAGYCVAIDATSVPSNGASITAIDFCYFDTTPKGCSLGRQPGPPRYYTNGVILLITSATTPFTYTTGTDTGGLSVDAK